MGVEGMKKGFIFSLDAALALMVVMALGAMMLVYFQASQPETAAYATSDRIAQDSAIVGFYLEKTPSEMGLASSIGASKFGSCMEIYRYGIIAADGTQNGPLSAQKYCKGIG